MQNLDWGNIINVFTVKKKLVIHQKNLPLSTCLSQICFCHFYINVQCFSSQLKFTQIIWFYRNEVKWNLFLVNFGKQIIKHSFQTNLFPTNYSKTTIQKNNDYKKRFVITFQTNIPYICHMLSKFLNGI